MPCTGRERSDAMTPEQAKAINDVLMNLSAVRETGSLRLDRAVIAWVAAGRPMATGEPAPERTCGMCIHDAECARRATFGSRCLCSSIIKMDHWTPREPKIEHTCLTCASRSECSLRIMVGDTEFCAGPSLDHWTPSEPKIEHTCGTCGHLFRMVGGSGSMTCDGPLDCTEGTRWIPREGQGGK